MQEGINKGHKIEIKITVPKDMESSFFLRFFKHKKKVNKDIKR